MVWRPASALVAVGLLVQIFGSESQAITDSRECRLCPETCLSVPRSDGSCPICICNGAALPDCPELPDFCPRNCVLRRNNEGCNQCACMRENPIICPPLPPCPEECQQIMDEDGCPRCICDAPPRTCPAITCPEGCTEELGSDGCISCRCQRTEICPAMQPCLRGCIENDPDSGCFFCNCTLISEDPAIPPNENRRGIGPFGPRPSDVGPIIGNNAKPSFPTDRCRNERLFCPSDCRIVVAAHGCRECMCGEDAYLCPGVPRCSNRCLFLSPQDKCCRCDCRGPGPINGVLTITVLRVPPFKPGRPFIPYGTFGPDIDFDEIPFLPPFSPREPGNNCTVDPSTCNPACRVITDSDGCPQCDCPGDLCPRIRCPPKCVTEIAPNGCPICNCRQGPTAIKPDSETIGPFTPTGPFLPEQPNDPGIPLIPTDPVGPAYPSPTVAPNERNDPLDNPLTQSEPINPSGIPLSHGDPMMPIEPVWPANPMMPVEPHNPMMAVDPAGPGNPMMTVDPAGPGIPLLSADPAEPGIPLMPGDLAGPGIPLVPAGSAGPGIPLMAADPAGPGIPLIPVEPLQPSDPMIQTQPDGPGNPMNPVVPGGPATTMMPMQPEKPGNPMSPTEPQGTGNVMTPMIPGVPSNTTTSTDPKGSSNPLTPTKPREPMNSLTPVEPKLPSHTSGTPSLSPGPENPKIPDEADVSATPTLPSDDVSPDISTIPDVPAVSTDPNTPAPTEQPLDAALPGKTVNPPPSNVPNNQSVPEIPDDTESFFESTLRTSAGRIPQPSANANNTQEGSNLPNGTATTQNPKENKVPMNIGNENILSTVDDPQQNDVDPGLVVSP